MKHKEPIRLHLGAFDCAIEGWVNTDITPHLIISYIPFAARILYMFGRMNRERYLQHRAGRFRLLKYMDLTKRLPYHNETVSVVFSSHVFEHLFFDEVERLVFEIKRILVPGGICRVIVPDLDAIVQAYNSENPKPFLDAIYEVSKRTNVKNSHHCGFTKESIVSLFLSAGFRSAYIRAYREGLCPDIDRLDNRPGSIFFEAIK